MKKIFIYYFILLTPVLFVACSKDDEPNGGGVVGQHEYVDLGLPSGTLWATMNVGANSPEEYGYYFAWGETAPKSVYDWSTYKWYDSNNSILTKYCISDDYGTVDNNTELKLADDAAYVNWGSSWCIPTWEQINELRKECTWTWTTMNGISGYKVASNHNSKSLFLPACGFRYDNTLSSEGSLGEYWSSSLDTEESGSSYCAYSLEFVLGRLLWNRSYRQRGNCIRPVLISKNVSK